MDQSKDLAERRRIRKTLTVALPKRKALSLTKAERASTARKRKQQEPEEKP